MAAHCWRGMGENYMYGLRDSIVEQIREFGTRYRLEKIVLFGSRARGDYRERSDIDLAVYGALKSQESRIYFEIDDYVETLLKFDIIFIDEHTSQELKDNIQQDGVVIYEKE